MRISLATSEVHRVPGVTWLNLEEKVTSLTAAFWTLCNLGISVFGSPYSRLLK